MVTVVASAPARSRSSTIDPKAIDPDDPEMLADLVIAAVNEALRAAHAEVEREMAGSAARAEPACGLGDPRASAGQLAGLGR